MSMKKEVLIQQSRSLPQGTFLRGGPSQRWENHMRLLGPSGRHGLAGSVFIYFIRNGITNSGPFLLELADVNMVRRGDSSANGITATHPCARTIVRNSSIFGFRGYGVLQRSGALALFRSAVRFTAAAPTYLTQGTAVHVSCGAQAYLVDVDLDGNETSELQVTGNGTVVHGILLRVSDTDAHPAFADPTFVGSGRGGGAVQVRDGAALYLSMFDISHSTFVGLSAIYGGFARLSSGRVAWTGGLNEYFGDSADERKRYNGGFNIASGYGSTLTVSNFVLDQASLCGVVVAPDGGMDLHHGIVDNAVVGACVQATDFDTSRLRDDVQYRNVGVPLQAPSYSLPETVGDPVDP